MIGRAAGQRLRPVLAGGFALLAACSGQAAAPTIGADDFKLINRLTWGANAREAAAIQRLGAAGWTERQLTSAAAPAVLPPAIQATIDAMPIARQPMGQLAVEMETLRRSAPRTASVDDRLGVRRAYTERMKDYTYQSIDRSLLRDIYSPDQLREQMTWFWFNHFNVRISHLLLAVMVTDYEEKTIRPRALGKFCDLVNATLRHPAMLIYLNNTANTAARGNENYARELMELHTMGVGSGYTQQDVQQLAKVRTGAGVDITTWPPAPAPRGGVRDGLFVYDPAKHDGSARMLLGQRLQKHGLEGIDEATGILCRQPATAQRIAFQIAQYFVGDAPPPKLVASMAETYRGSDGDITAILRTMIAAPEFKASLGTLYKDPQHYVLSALRLAFADRTIADARPAGSMLNELGQGRFVRLTPDGYPLDAASWNASGQLATRFSIAGRMAGGMPRLFGDAGDAPAARQVPDLKGAVAAGLYPDLAPATREALGSAAPGREWNTLFLSSPEFMRR